MSQSSTAAIWFSSLLRSCACTPLSAVGPGKQAHAQILAHGLLPHVTLQTDLLLMYSRCSHLELARRVFDEMTHRNMHSWNILLSSYVQNSLYGDALSLLCPFLEAGLGPDHFTFPSLFKACAGIGECFLGRELHSWVIRRGFEDHVVVRSSILDMYAKCENVAGAHQLFATMSNRDVVVWNSMISGFVRAGLSFEALGLFRRLQLEGAEMDPSSIPCVLSACGREGDIMRGKEIHGRVIRCLVFDCDVAVGNSLIDMYAKCGSLESSRRVFSNMRDRNLVTWSTLISCYGVHGKGRESLDLYNEMISQGFKPNCITFTSVLSSCSHAGLIGEGQMVFESLSRDYGVKPSVEHYACMVDLLGRSGSVKEALELIEKMPMEPSASVWGALLGACAVHKNVKIGEIAASKLFEMEAGNPSNYVTLCSIYEAAGLRDGVSNIRSRIRELSMVKTPGCIWIAIKGRLHAFYQGDIFHPCTDIIYETLDGLFKMMVLPE